MGKHSVWLIATLLVGCIDSSSVQCGFGLCPEGSRCDEAAMVCIPAGCGDGVVSGTEQCDGSVDPAFDCTAYGFYDPDGLTCSSDCRLDTSGCTQTCGDHQINGPETCDGIPPVGRTCGDYGFEIGRLGCSIECAPGFTQCGSIGWQRGIGSAPDDLKAIWGSSSTDIYAVGLGGVILHTGPTGYMPELSGVTQNLLGVWGTGPTDIFVVGEGGTLLHGNGTTWTPVTSGTMSSLRAISGHTTYVDNQITNVQIWAVGDNGTIITTSYAVTPGSAPDGTGAAWTAEASGVTVSLHGVWADGTAAVVAVGDATTTGIANPTALRRELATEGWTAIPTQAISPVNPMATPTLNAVWGNGSGFVAVGTATNLAGPVRGTVLEYTPTTGGAFVFTIQSTSAQTLLSVWGVVSTLPSDHTKTRTDVFIGGNQGTMLHFNGFIGAANFEALNMNTTLGAAGIWGTGPAFVRAAMLGGGIEVYDGTDLSSTTVAPLVKLQTVWHDSGSSLAIAAGANGTVSRHDFTGWAAPTTPNGATGTWTGVLGFGTNVFLCGEGGNGIVKSTDGGQNYSSPAFAAGIFWQGMWGLSTSSIWAVGNGGHISHYDGTTWAAVTAIPFTPEPDLRSVWGTSDTDLYAVGTSGFIAHYNGTTWTQLDSTVTSQNLNSVWGTATNNVFAVGSAGLILHYDGVSWRRMTSGTGGDLNAVGGTGPADVFVGGRGVLYHYSGVSWTPMNPTIDDVYALWSEQQDTYFVGTGDVAHLRRTALVTEARCSDPWDNDYNGVADCADSDCYPVGAPADSGCRAGGACGPTLPLACGAVTDGASTFSGIARLDDLPCLDHATPGPEAAYKLVADHDGDVIVTLDDPGGQLDLAYLDSFDDTRIACDPGHCIAAPASGDRSVTIHATATKTYYIVVDGPTATAEAFTLSVACP